MLRKRDKRSSKQHMRHTCAAFQAAGMCAGCGLGMMNFPRTGLAIAAIAALPVIIRECKDCIAQNRERDSVWREMMAEADAREMSR